MKLVWFVFGEFLLRACSSSITIFWLFTPQKNLLSLADGKVKLENSWSSVSQCTSSTSLKNWLPQGYAIGALLLNKFYISSLLCTRFRNYTVYTASDECRENDQSDWFLKIFAKCKYLLCQRFHMMVWVADRLAQLVNKRNPLQESTQWQMILTGVGWYQ